MELDFLSAGFVSALFAIVLIDLVLAGDNALIIGLVARNLPKNTQRKVIFWGTFGAIAVRAIMAILVVYILDLPGFMLAGGLALVWIARKLLTPEEGTQNHLVKGPATSFAGAIRTIVIADAVMGVDNVLAIGGAAHGSILLIVLGLAAVTYGSRLSAMVLLPRPSGAVETVLSRVPAAIFASLATLSLITPERQVVALPVLIATAAAVVVAPRRSFALCLAAGILGYGAARLFGG